MITAYREPDRATGRKLMQALIASLSNGVPPALTEQVHTDHGPDFQSSFHWHLFDRGIGYCTICPATPRLGGKAERSQRIDAEKFGLLHLLLSQ